MRPLYDSPAQFNKGTLLALHLQAKMKQRIVRLSGELMKTGQDVTQPGLYVSECCGEEVLLEKDASFPRCRRCNGLSEWELVDSPEEEAA
ncbi:MAG: hypothetical protein DMG13_05265 [Acidobacteria bacterium]|nr:MAG: hypothetical protein DMG13_05265 [Acidobacteriota bacterium]